MVERAARLDAMRDLLKKQPVVTIREFAKALDASEMTVRRDLSLLKDQGVVSVFHGGVSLRSTASKAYDIDQELATQADQKMRIAQKAASLIEQGDVLLIDTGSTTASIIQFIPEDSRNVVYCYALNIIQGVCAKPNLSVVACGGLFHRNTRMFASEEGAQLIKKTRINKAFMSTRGITADVGITTAESYEMEMKQAAIASSRQRILLADSSKMGKAWYARYARLEDFDMVITDSDVEDKYVKMCREAGVEVCIV